MKDKIKMSKKKLIGIIGLLTIVLSSIGYSAWILYATTQARVTIESTGSGVYVVSGFEDITPNWIDVMDINPSVTAVFGNLDGETELLFTANVTKIDTEDDCLNFENDMSTINWSWNGEQTGVGELVTLETGSNNVLNGSWTQIKGSCPGSIDIFAELSAP